MSALSDALNEANVDHLSVREIARRGGDRVHHSALGKYLKPNHGRPGEDVLEVFSEVLRIPMPRLRRLAELPAGDDQPYEPPREANRLDRRQRRLVDELIRMLAETKAGDGDVDRDAAPIAPGAQPGMLYLTTGSGKTESLAQLLSGLPKEQYDGVVTSVTRAAKTRGSRLTTKQVREVVDAMAGANLDVDPGVFVDVAARPSTD